VIHLLVRAETPGVQRQRIGSLDLVRRHADIGFDGVVVADSSIIIDVERGQSVRERQGQIANVLQRAKMVGAATRAFELTLEYAAERHSFGRSLASYQVLKHRLADMKLWIEASQAALEGAVVAVTREAPSAPQLVSTAKLYVGRKAADVVQDCIQIHVGARPAPVSAASDDEPANDGHPGRSCPTSRLAHWALSRGGSVTREPWKALPP
jgi:alkylation response protein AidB-like acyl-CoA dehydrogenase